MASILFLTILRFGVLKMLELLLASCCVRMAMMSSLLLFVVEVPNVVFITTVAGFSTIAGVPAVAVVSAVAGILAIASVSADHGDPILFVSLHTGTVLYKETY
jgi:hypothetical protein